MQSATGSPKSGPVMTLLRRGHYQVLRDKALKSKRVRLIVRLDFPTSPTALHKGLLDGNVEVRFFTDATFHPKLHIFGSRSALVGSANLGAFIVDVLPSMKPTNLTWTARCRGAS